MHKNAPIALGAVVVLLLGALVFRAQSPVQVSVNSPEPQIGAQSGLEHYYAETFFTPFIAGGNVFASTSQGAGTYTAANLINTSLIQHTAGAALTVTLPASSTLTNFIPRAGDTRTIYFNAITTLITIAGGTGTELNTASSTKNVNAGGLGRLDFTRKTNSDIEVLLTTGI